MKILLGVVRGVSVSVPRASNTSAIKSICKIGAQSPKTCQKAKANRAKHSDFDNANGHAARRAQACLWVRSCLSSDNIYQLAAAALLRGPEVPSSPPLLGLANDQLIIHGCLLGHLCIVQDYKLSKRDWSGHGYRQIDK